MRASEFVCRPFKEDVWVCRFLPSYLDCQIPSGFYCQILCERLFLRLELWAGSLCVWLGHFVPSVGPLQPHSLFQCSAPGAAMGPARFVSLSLLLM